MENMKKLKKRKIVRNNDKIPRALFKERYTIYFSKKENCYYYGSRKEDSKDKVIGTVGTAEGAFELVRRKNLILEKNGVNSF
jgi:hypothetical protein